MDTLLDAISEARDNPDTFDVGAGTYEQRMEPLPNPRAGTTEDFRDTARLIIGILIALAFLAMTVFILFPDPDYVSPMTEQDYEEL